MITDTTVSQLRQRMIEDMAAWAINPISAGISVLPSPPARGRSLPAPRQAARWSRPWPDPRAWPHPGRRASHACA